MAKLAFYKTGEVALRGHRGGASDGVDFEYPILSKPELINCIRYMVETFHGAAIHAEKVGNAELLPHVIATRDVFQNALDMLEAGDA